MIAIKYLTMKVFLHSVALAVHSIPCFEGSGTFFHGNVIHLQKVSFRGTIINVKTKIIFATISHDLANHLKNRCVALGFKNCAFLPQTYIIFILVHDYQENCKIIT